MRWKLRALALFLCAVVPFPGSSAGEEAATPIDATSRKGEAYAHLMRSVFSARRGDFEAAHDEVLRAIEREPDSPEVHVQGASLMLWIGRGSDAEELARRALVLTPNHPGALRFVAELQASRALGPRRDSKSRDEAIRLYEQLVRQSDSDDDALRKLAGLKRSAGDREGAIEAARKLVDLRPGDRRDSGMLAQWLLDAGRETEALRVLLGFLGEHPNDLVLVELSESLVGEIEAWDVVAEVFGAHPGFAERPGIAQRLYGEALLRSREAERAVRALEQALRAEPSAQPVRFNLARAYRIVGRRADAAALCRELAREAPDSVDVHLLLARTLDEQGDRDGAVDAYTSALEVVKDADDPVRAASFRDAIRLQTARLHVREGQFAAARRLLADLERPETGEVHELVAQLAIGEKDWAGAREAADRVRASGEAGAAEFIEGEILARSGRSTRARAKFEEAIRIVGARIRASAAEVFREVERADLGEALLRDWVETEPANGDAHYALGSFLYGAGRREVAETSLREAFRLNPTHAPALNFLGYSLAEQNERLEEALELIRRALSVDAWNGAYLDSLGWAYYRMGRYDEAREPLERAAREFPFDPTVLEHLGDLYNRLGELDLALTTWNRALEAGAGDAETLRRKIARARGPGSDDRSSAGPSVVPPAADPRPVPPALPRARRERSERIGDASRRTPR